MMTNEHSKAYKQVFARDNPPGEAHGWIQWKGTDVCMDLHCKCGAHMHFDGDFFYNFQCPHCNRKYAVGQTVALIELTEDEADGLGGEFKTVAKEDDDVF